MKYSQDNLKPSMTKKYANKRRRSQVSYEHKKNRKKNLELFGGTVLRQKLK